MLNYLAVTVLTQATQKEICTEDTENVVYGSCGGYDSDEAVISFGGTSNLGFSKNLGYGDVKKTVPAIFPCKVDKHGRKLVSLGLQLPKTTLSGYLHKVKVYLRSGADCYVHSVVNPEEKPACILDMNGERSTCSNLTKSGCQMEKLRVNRLVFALCSIERFQNIVRRFWMNNIVF